VYIAALCPYCRSAYQVQATLRGQPVRCPNAACRKIFTVPVEIPSPPTPAARPQPPRPSPPPGNGQRSGSVGDLVPMLPAESASAPSQPASGSQHVSEVVPVVPAEPAPPSTTSRPAEGDWWQAAPSVRKPASPKSEQPAAAAPSSPPSPPASDAPWWGAAPPPVRTPRTPSEPPAPAQPTRRPRAAPKASAETQPIPVLPAEQSSQPRDLPPGVWEPPPVRRGAGKESVTTLPETATAAETTTAHRPRLGKRGAVLLILGLFVLTFGVLGGVGLWVWSKYHRSEDDRFAEARADYEQGAYGSAANKFDELARKFPDSPRAKEYRFMADWCAVCGPAADPDAPIAPAAEKLEHFVSEHKKDPFMSEYASDGGRLTVKATRRFAERNASPVNDEPLKTAETIERLQGTLAALTREALSNEENKQIQSDLAQVRQGVQRWRKRNSVMVELDQRANETPMDALRRARSLLAQWEHELPGISADPEAKEKLERLYKKHFDSVVYQPGKADDQGAKAPPQRDGGDDDRTVLFAPFTASPGSAPQGDPIVLALARGVLYALKRGNGELKWGMRVGIDTTVLPLRVRLPGRELLLVVSADTNTLMALNDNGDTLWEYSVGKPVLGRPIIIGPRAYLGAYDGTIHEIELARGQLLGRWSLGQRLTCGGTRESDESTLIYYPADDSCIYVLDVNPRSRRCVTILYDGHPSGSLRSEPIVVPPSEAEAMPGYLILNEASGLDAMRPRVFELPLQDRHAAPLTLEPPPRLAGWTWFEPGHDPEKLAFLSDAGILGLFGIRQPGNRDQPLFPLLEPKGLDLSPFLQTDRALPRERGRAQVVHVQGDDLWVLAHGRLQQVRIGWKTAMGPQASPGWKKPLTLGSPLHEAQRIEDRNTGESTFYLVTQSLEQQTCLASAVDEHGRIIWQRQLGMVCRGEPLTLTPPQGGPPMLLVLDQGGGLFALEPPPPNKTRVNWHYLKGALDDNPRVPPRLLLSADGHSAYEVAAPGDGKWLVVRQIEWANGERQLRVKERKMSLLIPGGKSVISLAGTPAVVGAQLIVPLMDGNIARLALPLNDDPKLKTGPSWRQGLAPQTASCNVLALDSDRFLASVDGRRLLVWEWPAGNEVFHALPQRGETVLDNLLAAPPVLLPAKDQQPPRVIAADSAGWLHLFEVTPDGALRPKLEWDRELPGRLTAGPFVYPLANGGWRLGCVLDQNRLVWIDPDKRDPQSLWTYPTGGDAIIGEPKMIQDLLVVALSSGRYVGLDPSSGRPCGDGYELRTSAAPASAPAPFGPGGMLAPLSDGTALRLDVEQLRKSAKK
jgi:hypothetical protein